MKPFVTFSRRFIIGLFAFLMLTFLVTSFFSTVWISQRETMSHRAEILLLELRGFVYLVFLLIAFGTLGWLEAVLRLGRREKPSAGDPARQQPENADSININAE